MPGFYDKSIFLPHPTLLPVSVFAQTTDMYFDKAIELYSNKDYNGALEYFTKEIELNPTNLEAYNYRGIIKSQLGGFAGRD